MVKMSSSEQCADLNSRLCSVGLGRLSQLPRAAADIDKPSITEQSEMQPWRPYEDANLCLSPSAQQPARQMTFVACLSNLSELASEMVNTFYAPRERFTSRRLATTKRVLGSRTFCKDIFHATESICEKDAQRG